MTYFCRFALVFNFLFAISAMVALAGDGQLPVSEETRHDLLKARETAWRAFFAPEPDTAIEQALGTGSDCHPGKRRKNGRTGRI